MKKDNVLKLESAEMTPTDVAISRHIQNLFATYGEEAVKASMKELFGLCSKAPKSKKVA
jgi:hypothetical protein